MPMLHFIRDTSALVCSLFGLHMLRLWYNSRRVSRSLPPGPRGLPLIGNYFDMQDAEMWEVARKWGEEYGPLVYIRSFKTPYIYLNANQVAVDLFEKRSSIYSSRPRIPIMELEGWDWLINLNPYGNELRSARRMLHQFLQPMAVSEYIELQTQSAHRMLERLLDAPDNYAQLLRQSVGEAILQVTYGYRPLLKDDPYITLIEECLDSFTNSLGFFLVNTFPSLQYLPAWLPGAGFQKTISEGRRLSKWLAQKPHEMAKKLMSDGMATSSMTSRLMDAKRGDDGIVKDEALIAKVTGITYAGGADTSVSALHTFLLAMLLYPDVQQRAQAEIDKVVGKDVLPSFNDRPMLPYIEAIIKEVIRWQPVSPLSAMHISDEDDEYNGYSIPAGANIFLNIWAITRNPEEYPEPDEFIPERWLPNEGKEPPFDILKVAFGVGRRICPGRYFASDTIFITVVSILSAFNITKALDENGVPITPRGDYKALPIRYPEPFNYILTPRSDKIESVIRQAIESAK